MSNNKTISVNMSLFTPKARTKRAREKKERQPVPLISPNVLKAKLLKRIKEHKQKETTNFGKQIPAQDKNQNKHSSSQDAGKAFSDEFNVSVNYLQLLANQKKKEAIERRTVRNHHTPPTSSLEDVHLELPEELREPVILIPPPSEPLRLHRSNEVPYSNLKGGSKPSYREWSKTQRSNIVTNPNASLIVPTAREQRLAQLRAKIQGKQRSKMPMQGVESVDPQAPSAAVDKVQAPTQAQVPAPVPAPAQVQVQVPTPVPTPVPLPQVQVPTQMQTQSMVTLPLLGKEKESPNIQAPTLSVPVQAQAAGGKGKVIATKHITKKTIKRKYTLGRSRIKKTVGVLVKDKGTRKRVLAAQKDLKRKNINDIKQYLRDHNLIKVGSNAPNDVLRKLYESAMLAGEITNSNSDTLLHNFSKEDKDF